MDLQMGMMISTKRWKIRKQTVSGYSIWIWYKYRTHNVIDDKVQFGSFPFCDLVDKLATAFAHVMSRTTFTRQKWSIFQCRLRKAYGVPSHIAQINTLPKITPSTLFPVSLPLGIRSKYYLCLCCMQYTINVNICPGLIRVSHTQRVNTRCKLEDDTFY